VGLRHYSSGVDIDGIFSAIVAGLLIGFLARWLAPGKGRLGLILTLLVGMVGALVGEAVAEAIDVGSFWLTFVIQIVAAAILVGALRPRRGR
jgi:uncharacterized membrane protein YeaQ/YmgE (transglycosylase-associated protein family)